MKKLNLLCLLIGGFVCNSLAQVSLPRADFENTFYLMPLYEGIRVPGRLSYETKEAQMLKMMDQLGPGNLYHRLGFSMIYSPGSDIAVREVCELARKHGTHVGLIFALQSHTRPDYRKIADKDLRLYQWRMDGEDWKGAFTSSGTLEIPEDQRDYKIPTPSRLAHSLREYNGQKATDWATSVLKLMEDYPGVVACINGPIEEELAIGGHSDANKLADYSPYAITEFRDWVRHTGIYDDTDGDYAGEGATAHVIGALVDFNGTLRSQFYDDPTPDNSNGTGVSFNEFFGKQFSTWSLKYWDLQIYPDPITDPGFDCSPESGLGFTAGGFDAPRSLNLRDRLWEAWTYDIPDQAGQYPAGNPGNPGFGFRQNLVRNFTRDLFDVLEAAGLPRKIMYAHQIPGEALGNFTGAGGRNRSSASTIWTGYMEKSGTVGLTRFGDIDPSLATQYAPDWGIFEWHTLPNPHLQMGDLYAVSLNHLNRFYAAHCHMLFPGWWREEAPAADETFPLNDSKFAQAIGDFMRNREEIPYRGWDDTPDFIPPVVSGVVAGFTDSGVLVSWDDHLWPDLVARWPEWDGFKSFEIALSRNGQDWLTADTAENYQNLLGNTDTVYQVRVRAFSTTYTPGSWSEVVSSFRDTASLSLVMSGEYEHMYADPEISNRITVSFSDPEHPMDTSIVSLSIRGEGSNLNTSPAGVEEIEMFWPFNSLSDSPGQHGLDHFEVAGGIFSATVSSEEPVDPYFILAESALNGTELPHIAFRMYSSMENTGQFYWFEENGFHSVTYPIKKGWQVIRLDSLEEWISLEQINQFRIDPGTVGGAKIKVDWVAVSSEKLGDELQGDILVTEHGLSMLTSPTDNPGGYTVVMHYGELSDSIFVDTDTVNTAPAVSLLEPGEDMILEAGKSLMLSASAMDPDGQIDSMLLRAGPDTIAAAVDKDIQLAWFPEGEGLVEVFAMAMDNAGVWSASDTVSIEVFAQEAYKGFPHPIPGIIEAEDYDLGGEAVAYHDIDAENLGGQYRQDGVDIGAIPDGAGGYYVGWIASGEWMEYLLELAEGIKTEIALLVAAPDSIGELHLELDDARITQRFHIPVGAAYDTLKINDLYLPPGVHKLKVVADKGGFLLDKMDISEYAVFLLGTESRETGLKVYPNPVGDELLLRTDFTSPCVVRLWSLEGSLMKTSRIAPDGVQRINVSDLPAGIYILDLETDGTRLRERIFKL